ncbi:MAG: winged helix-turn-helix domain-containing protein [Kastovskya adunca ATA6-11-RM4]|jgi:DNA-binding response OmpR family regulator|nr:winged helix-turn-helix domain-containing protein [Kastovskya adunca ATA6-11-RM4]
MESTDNVLKVERFPQTDLISPLKDTLTRENILSEQTFKRVLTSGKIRREALQMRSKAIEMRARAVQMREFSQHVYKNLDNLKKSVLHMESLMTPKSASPSQLTWGELQLDTESFQAAYSGKALALTAKEYRLLQLFVEHGYRVLNREQILQHLWTDETAPKEDTVKAHIKHLRKKLNAVGAPSDFIETVYGVGYRLK